MPTLSPDILTAALEGYEQQKIRIDSRIAEIRALLSGTTTESATESIPTTGARRKMSAAARKRMSEAQRRRRSEAKGQSEPISAPANEAAKPGRRLSAAGRAAIVAVLKKRWAAKKAATENGKPTAAKKRTARKG